MSVNVVGPPQTGGAQSRGLDTRTLLAAGVGIAVTQLIFGIPATVNGLFQGDLGPTSSQMQWIIAAFQLPVTMLELTFGVFGDLFGRKRLMVGGSALAVVGLTIAVCTPGPGTATSTRLAVLWIGQAVAGIGVAAIIPTTLAMVAAGTKHDAAARSRGLTIWSVSLALGTIAAPAVGALVATHPFGSTPDSGWRWSFLVSAVLALIGMVLALRATDSSDPVGRSLDWPGQITIAVALLGLIFAVIEAPTVGWGSGQVIGGFVVAVIALVSFVVAELRSSAPLLQLRLFAHRPFAIAMAANLLGMFAFLGSGYSAALRLAAVQGHTPLRVGIALVLQNAVGLLLYPIVRRALRSRRDPRWLLGIGLAMIAAGNFWLMRIPITHLSIDFTVVAPLVLTGGGFAISVNSVASVTVNTVPRHMIGMASATNSMLRDLGFTLAPSVLGAVALGHAASGIRNAVATNPTLAQAVQRFNGLPSTVPPAERPGIAAAVGAVNSGPLGANGVPATMPGPNGSAVPFNPLHETAFHALGSGYSIAFMISGFAALIAAILTVTVISGRAAEEVEEAERNPA